MTPVFASSGDLSADRRFLWARAAAEEGDHAAAADLFGQALEIVPRWTVAWFERARCLFLAGEREAGAEAARRCLALDPDDRLGAGLLLARSGHSGDAPTVIPHAYIAGLFDGYADRFDAHLTGALGYRGPAVIREALLATFDHEGITGPLSPALDLGCGTGLMAPALAGIAGAIDGIDLSPRMIDKARITGHYRSLHAGDISEVLATSLAGEAYRLVTAADVLVYILDLAPLFAAVRRVSEPGTPFAFTVQSAEGDHPILGEDLRAAHPEGYLRRIAAQTGWRVALAEAVSTRRDAGVDVPGLVAVMIAA